MRLAKVTVEGFRGLPAAQDFDLDADAVVVVGANGSGKTSLLDAVLWALTGRLARVEDGGGSVRSGFAPDERPGSRSHSAARATSASRSSAHSFLTRRSRA